MTGEPGPGRIVLVGTPIGNLSDLSERAVTTLGAADVIACEDTRRTRKLLSHAGITGKRLVALHEHNEESVAGSLVLQAARGETVAVVSDAGMPAISDPGERVVRAAVDAGVSVEVVPGPTALTAALVLSGLATSRWCFEGFLPRKGRERAARLAAIAAEERTTVLYEAPHRLRRTVADLAACCDPGRELAVSRELTKLHEETWRGRLDQAVAWLAGTEPRGEYVLVLAGEPSPAASAASDVDILAALRERLAAGDDRKVAVSAVSARLGVPRRSVYEASLALPAYRPDE